MKHFLKLLCSLMIFCTASVHAQKEKVVFPYSHDSLIELIKDTNWLKASAEKYLKYENNDSTIQNFFNKISACAFLNENEEGLKLVSKELSRMEKSVIQYSVEKAMFSTYYGYFYAALHPGKNSYYNAVKQTFAKYNPSIDDRKVLYKMYHSILTDSILSDDSIASKLSKFYPTLKNLKRKEKVLTPWEMGAILSGVSSDKFYFAKKEEQIKFLKEQLPIIDSLKKKYDLLWGSRLYHFSSTDHPQTIVAADFQLFNKDDFPTSQIWVNKKEIPGNGVDDDRNGFIDDINGVMYIKNKKLDAIGIPLVREKAKEYFDSTTNYNTTFRHGTMTVELMLKDNPYVKIMGLEHNQYDSVWKKIFPRFTKNIEHNRKLIDSLIELRLKIWKNLVLYCNENKVRVAEINSMGFLLNGDEFVLTGCGKDSADTKHYTEKKFWQLVKGYDDIFNLSPNTLFVMAAGNDGIDNISNKELVSCIHTPNTLIVGALGKDLKRKDYSNYGKDVEIYAPANFDLVSYKDSYPESDGTSASSPVTCNLAIKLFCLNPKLSPVQVKKLIINSSDRNLFEEGINVINPKKAVALMRETMK